MLKKRHKKFNKETRRNNGYDIQTSEHLSQNVKSVRNIIGESDDVIQRELTIGHRVPAVLFYIEELCDEKKLEENVIKPLVQLSDKEMSTLFTDKGLEYIQKEVLTISEASIYSTFDEAILPVMRGQTLLVIDGLARFIVVDAKGYPDRGINEPETEILIRGPRDGFNETLQVNLMLLRKRINDPSLTIQTSNVGRRGKTKFAICYMKGIATTDLVDEVRYRLACIDIDEILETGMLEQFMEENTFSPFPEVLQTERPDRTAKALTDGRVAVLLDGTPFSILAPVTLHQLLKSPEDIYERWMLGTFVRILRYMAAFFSLFLPGLYIAMVSFHQGMIPTTLTLSIAGAREGVPFPGFIEAFIMEMIFELLREAGNRLPRPIGQTVGIVGGLIIGEAAVQAGIVSPIMVIVVALTAISNFSIPTYSAAISFRLLRFTLMIAAALFGLYGIMLVYIAINVHLVGLRSFGSYYTSPFAPYNLADLMDAVVRFPTTVLRKRPSKPRKGDEFRQPPKNNH
ncbi:spore germination protein [Salicibibacter kimchii]|uniref:Spore germination protein n=1 Tax=Salicibibacter kimchii TaxID=2099786 RepID=A0A345C2K6_9BACI|nr:spore germination protein [Salicibibacter kimchii]AXF57437.1 spore germination protein [Salicibibacter kimchii]